jgi:hypothetical protein
MKRKKDTQMKASSHDLRGKMVHTIEQGKHDEKPTFRSLEKDFSE